MPKNKTAYLVLHGSIQDTNALIPAGELFTPATTEFASELLDAGIIGPVPAATAKGKAAAAKAQTKPEAVAVIDDDDGDGDEEGEGDGEEHDADAGSTADDDATE